MNSEKFVVPGQVGESKLSIVEEGKNIAWGIYIWKKANGKPFTDGNGNVLNVPSHRGDVFQIRKLEQTAKELGQEDGSYEFYPGMGRISDEEYSEQIDRMKQGLIPSQNDLGALIAAKNTFNMYGSDE
jgi:hypothetical protein